MKIIIQKRLYNYFIFIFIVFFSGCSKKISKKSFENHLKNSQHEAKFVDIPIPLNIQQINNCITDNCYAFKYLNENLEELIKFYFSEMELFGWRQKFHLSSCEELLIFEKPNKNAIVSIRKNKNYFDVFIFVIKE